MKLVGLEAVELRTELAGERAARAAADRRLAETAHDLRGALASIIGYADMLGDPQQQGVDAREVAGRISRLAQGLCDITTDLLVRDDAERAAAKRRRVSARDLLENCAQAIEPQCRAKGIALRLERPGLGDFRGHPTLLRRIVQNLLTNAVHYTERGEIRLRGCFRGDGFCIEVSDTGIGIDAADLERIFADFCRLDPARRMAPSGVGLGLATVKRLCDQLGARIEVESRVGTGSTFRVRVPLRRANQRRRVEEAELF